MEDHDRKLLEEVENQRKKIAEVEKLYEENMAAEASLFTEFSQTRETTRKDKKENVSIQKEFHRHCAGSPITGMTAYVMAAFADVLAEKYVSAVGEMVAFDVQLDQQSKNVTDIAKSFDDTVLSFENNAVKNTIYKALRDIDEIDVNILDLVNARKSMATSLIQTAKTMRNSIDDMSDDYAKMNVMLAGARAQDEKLTGEMNEFRLKFNQIEEEIIEISLKLARLNDNE